MARGSRDRGPAKRTARGTDGVLIRPLRLRDYDAIVSVWRSAGLRFDPRGRESRTSIATQLRRNRGLYLGAFQGPDLVGVVLATHETRKGWINRLAVRPDHRRQGVATRLVRSAERALSNRGINVFAAHVDIGNAPSLRFFRRLGYAVYPVRYLRKKRRPLP